MTLLLGFSLQLPIIFIYSSFLVLFCKTIGPWHTNNDNKIEIYIFQEFSVEKLTDEQITRVKRTDYP